MNIPEGWHSPDERPSPRRDVLMLGMDDQLYTALILANGEWYTPAGQRIRPLCWHEFPLEADDVLSLADAIRSQPQYRDEETGDWANGYGEQGAVDEDAMASAGFGEDESYGPYADEV